MDDKRRRLDNLLSRRDTLREDVQRVTGRLEAARQEFEEVEEECREKGVDPDKLDDAIVRLTDRYDKAVTRLETSIQESEEALLPFMGEN